MALDYSYIIIIFGSKSPYYIKANRFLFYN
jgi:hypothetical protein